MLLVKRLVFVLEHIVEHGSILHIVPIDQELDVGTKISLDASINGTPAVACSF